MTTGKTNPERGAMISNCPEANCRRVRLVDLSTVGAANKEFRPVHGFTGAPMEWARGQGRTGCPQTIEMQFACAGSDGRVRKLYNSGACESNHGGIENHRVRVKGSQRCFERHY